MKGEIFMAMKNSELIETQLVTHEIFGDFRYFENDDGEIWWIAADVAKILGLKNIRKNLADFPDDERMTVANIYSHSGKRGGAQKFICVNEPGLYRLIFMSRKPEAEKFKRWVFHEVLPSIRKYGYYSLVDEKYQDREYLYKKLPSMTEEEKFNLVNEPDIVIWKTADDEEWRVSISGFPDIK